MDINTLGLCNKQHNAEIRLFFLPIVHIYNFKLKV